MAKNSNVSELIQGNLFPLLFFIFLFSINNFVYADQKNLSESKKPKNLQEHLTDSFMKKEAFLQKKVSEIIDSKKKLCQSNIGIECFKLALFYDYVKKDQESANQMDKKACDLRQASSCSRIAYFYENNESYQLAINYLEQACLLGEVLDCTSAADLYFKHKLPRSPTLEVFHKSCEDGNGVGCYGLASNTDDSQEKRKYFLKACDDYYSDACLKLALNFESHALDLGKAIEFYAKACDAENTSPCLSASKLAAKLGANWDPNVAWRNYYTACRFENLEGCLKGALLDIEYFKDNDSAKNLLNRACVMGYETSCDFDKQLSKSWVLKLMKQNNFKSDFKEGAFEEAAKASNTNTEQNIAPISEDAEGDSNDN